MHMVSLALLKHFQTCHLTESLKQLFSERWTGKALIRHLTEQLTKTEIGHMMCPRDIESSWQNLNQKPGLLTASG